MTGEGPAATRDGQLQPELLRLRHELLRATDRAVAAEATHERLRATVAAQQADIDRLTKAVRAGKSEREELRRQLTAMRASRTWRVGTAVVAPLARLARGRR